MPRSRSFTRLTMRVGLLHFGQSVDFVVSIIFLRSPVFAILAIGRVFLLLGLSLHTSAAADGFNGAVMNSPLAARDCQVIWAIHSPEGSRTRCLQFTSRPLPQLQFC